MRAGNVPAQLVMARACRPSKKILTPLELAAGWEADRIFMDRPDKPGDDEKAYGFSGVTFNIPRARAASSRICTIRASRLANFASGRI
jgi:hypothetical protein